MLQSQLFIKTKRESPKDEVSANAQLLIRGGFIDKLTAGVYTFLPLGFLVLKKIENIIREEINNIGGQEILMPALHPKELWEETGRWGSVDDLYKLKDRKNKDLALGPTHEEVITDIFRKRTISYKDLPLYLYQIQTKFRDELRSKSGLLRGREFLMKDLYSFHASEEDRKKYYEVVKEAYKAIFKRCGLSPIIAEASGGSFSREASHEFQVRTDGGEDVIVFCEKCDYAVNVEIADKKGGEKCPECSNTLVQEKSIEAGNIFTLGTKFTSKMGANFSDEDGKENPIIMGCYGIGVGRLLGSVAEVHHDEQGIIWPEEVSPFDVHLIALESKDSKMTEKVFSEAAKIHNGQKQTHGVLYDDRKGVSPGQKFADSDLIGVHIRIVVSEKTLKEGKVEIKKREGSEAKLVKTKDIAKSL